ncbi:MAG: hypothetical protein ACLUEK_04350 [Oscillospiraceae bacterium]
MDEWWDRLIPSMRENCTDLSTGNQYRICTNMTGRLLLHKEIRETGPDPGDDLGGLRCEPRGHKAAYPDVDPWFIFGGPGTSATS